MTTKNKILFITLMLVVSTASFGQVRIVNSLSNTTAINSSAFIDASSNATTNPTTNIGKGLVYPRMDLTKFVSFSGSPLGIGTSYPGRYDGMQVYNIGTGKTLSSASINIVDVVPGFWYYNNKSGTLTGGTWTEIGNVIKDIATATEVATAFSVDGLAVYATKGTFVANGTSAIVTIVPPTGITGIYRIAIYKTEVSTDSATAGNSISRKLSSEVFEFNLNSSTNNVVTGYSPFTVVYPAGTYNYTLEYFKQ